MKKDRSDRDVLVVGGGVAGIAAAFAAARNGAKTMLVESSYLLGGLATCGLVTIYLPLCDGEGHQLSFGLAEELLRLSVSHGAAAEYPAEWFGQGTKEERIAHRFRTQFDPFVFSLLAERELRKAGVEILFGATLSAATVRAGRLQSITCVLRSGSMELYAGRFIDATGDATLCAYAGEETRQPQHANVLAAWHYELCEGRNLLRMSGSCDYVYAQGAAEGGTAGLSGRELSELTFAAHEQILGEFLKNGSVSDRHALTAIPSIPQVRMTRCLCGREQLRKEDDKRRFENSVGLFGSWLERGRAFELPFGALVGKHIRNLGAAGRCISVAADDMWDITRVIPVCAVSGEAIGTAAALAEDFSAIDVAALQNVLRSRGVRIHLQEAGI